MALETTDGGRILSMGEYISLMKGLDPDQPSLMLGTWLEKGMLPPGEARVALAGARTVARTEKAHALIDTALLRLDGE